MTTEVVQENYTIEYDEQAKVVEIRYEGLNADNLAALTVRVDDLETELDQAIINSGGSFGGVEAAIAALQGITNGLTVDLSAEEAARIAGDLANANDLIAAQASLSADIAAEAVLREAADTAEIAARNAAISAATGPIITTADALALTVAGQIADLDAVELAQVSLSAEVTALDGEFDALSAEFASWSATFSDLEQAILDEAAARAAHNHDHGTLTGLSDDDHPQYGQLATAETVTGKWDFTYVPVSGFSSQFSGYVQLAGGAEISEYIEFVAPAGGYDYLSFYWGNYDGALDEKWWILESDASKKEFAIRSCGDTFSGASYRDHLKFRRSGQSVDLITLGDAADDPNMVFNTPYHSTQVGGYEYMSADSDGAVGAVGTYFELSSDIYSEVLLRSYVNDNYGPTFSFYKARGTKASPTQGLSGDDVGGFYYGTRGNVGNWEFPGAVNFVLDANTTGANTGSGWLQFQTGGGFFLLTPRLSIHTDGRVQLGTDVGLTFDEHASAPGTPASGKVVVYAKADGKMYKKDDGGIEAPIGITDHGDLTGLTDNDHPQYVKRHGFVVEAETWEVGMSYDAGTRAVTITPTGATFDIWVGGVKYTKTGAQVSGAHDTTSGGHFLTYDSAGTLQWSTTPWAIDDDAAIPVAYVYWNNEISDGAAWFEAHTFERSLVLHKNLHFTQGTKAESSGFALADYTLATDTDAAVTPSVASGKVYDEDIVRTAAAVVNGGPYTIWWREGTAGLWRWSTTDSFPFKAGTYPQRNYDAGGLTGWTLADISGVGLGQWVNVWVFTTTGLDSQNQTFFVVGQNVYTSLAAAQGESLSNISWGTIPFQEVAPLYKITLQAKSTFAGTYKAEIVAVERQLGGGASVISALTPTTHNSLSGRSDADVHPASSVTVTPAGTLLSTNVQAALEELDARPAGSGDVATDAIWDAKGDLAVGTGANTASKLTVGTDGYVLTADAVEATGVKWAAPVTGVTDHGALTGLADDDHPQYAAIAQAESITGEWTFPDILAVTYSGGAVTNMAYGNSTDMPKHEIWAGPYDAYPSFVVHTHATQKQNLYLMGGDGYVGGGVESEANALGVQGYSWWEITTYGKTATAAGGGGLYVAEVRGTESARVKNEVGDEVLALQLWGHPVSAAAQRTYADITGTVEAITGSYLGGSIDFRTSVGAASHTRNSRLKIMHDGEIKLGTDGFLTFDEHTSAPATPASGRVALYAKADGKVYCKDDAGTETDLTAGGAGGAVATDTIWDAKGDLAVGTGADTASKLTVGTDGYVLTADSAQATGVKWAAATGGGGGGASSAASNRTFGATWGNSSALVAADCADVIVHVPEAGTITGVYIYTQGGTGSCVVDIWNDTYANYPPTDADTITAAAVPTISSGVKYSDTTLTGWDKALTAGDVLVFHVDSTSTFTHINVVVTYRVPGGAYPAWLGHAGI